MTERRAIASDEFGRTAEGRSSWMAGFGRTVYGLGVISLGALIVWSLDLGAVFQPVPDSWPMPAQSALACLSGGVLVVP